MRYVQRFQRTWSHPSFSWLHVCQIQPNHVGRFSSLCSCSSSIPNSQDGLGLGRWNLKERISSLLQAFGSIRCSTGLALLIWELWRASFWDHLFCRTDRQPRTTTSEVQPISSCRSIELVCHNTCRTFFHVSKQTPSQAWTRCCNPCHNSDLRRGSFSIIWRHVFSSIWLQYLKAAQNIYLQFQGYRISWYGDLAFHLTIYQYYQHLLSL